MIFIQSPCITGTDFSIHTDDDLGESWIIPRPSLGHLYRERFTIHNMMGRE